MFRYQQPRSLISDSALPSDSIGCGIESMENKSLNGSLGKYLLATTDRLGSEADG